MSAGDRSAAQGLAAECARLRTALQEAERERDEARENGEGFRSSMYALEERVAALNAENANLNAENRDLFAKWSNRGAQVDALRGALAQAVQGLDEAYQEARAALATPDPEATE